MDMNKVIETEMLVLGGGVINSDWINLMIAEIEVDHFVSKDNIEIFSIIKELVKNGQSTSLDHVANFALKRGVDINHIMMIYQFGGSIIDYEEALTSIKDNYFKRRLQLIAQNVAAECDSEKQGQNIFKAFEEKLFQISQEREKTSSVNIQQLLKSPEPFMEEAYRKVELFKSGKQAFEGLPSGYIEFDKLVRGFAPGHLIVIGGRPGSGKTSFALNLIEHFCIKLGAKPLMFSIEMRNIELAKKLMCQCAEVSYSDFELGKINEKNLLALSQACSSWEKRSFIIDDQDPIRMDQIKARAIRHKKLENIDVVIIDYIQRVSASKSFEVRHLEIADISRQCKALAKQLNVPVIVLAQLNRETEKRESKVPQLSDLRESGQIEADADIVCLLNHDREKNPTKTTFYIRKNRFGPNDKFDLFWNGELGIFRNFQNERPNEHEQRINTAFNDEWFV